MIIFSRNDYFFEKLLFFYDLGWKLKTASNETPVWDTAADPADPANPADPADPAEVVSATAARTPPSTRAGGQDDVS